MPTAPAKTGSFFAQHDDRSLAVVRSVSMNHATKARSIVAVIVASACLLHTDLLTTAHAQWAVTVLHPPGAISSSAHTIDGSQQIGVAKFTAGLFDVSAVLWSGTAASAIDLTPAGAANSRGQGGDNGTQVGSVEFPPCCPGGNQLASLWNGTSVSWTSLHPAGATRSSALSAGNGQQVGSALIGQINGAMLWTGSAASATSLHPAGTAFSEARSVRNGQQAGGVAITSGQLRAAIWSGTAASWVDLHPAGAVTSEVLDTDGTQQAGYIWNGTNFRASLWTGSVGSWLDITPAGGGDSFATGVDNGYQVGRTTVAGMSNAAIWQGTAASHTNLHAFLPPEFESSDANSVRVQGAGIVVVGSGFNTATQRNEALMWTSTITPIPCPCDFDGDGLQTISDYFTFLSDFFAQLGGSGSADIDGDGIVNVYDLFAFLNCLPAISVSAPCP